VLLALRPVPGTDDMVEMRVAKNKYGRRHRDEEPGIFLRLDRDTQRLVEEATFTAPVSPASTGREVSDQVAVAKHLLANPGIGVRTLNREMRALGLAKERVEDARDALGEAVLSSTGKGRKVELRILRTALSEAVAAGLMAESGKFSPIVECVGGVLTHPQHTEGECVVLAPVGATHTHTSLNKTRPDGQHTLDYFLD